MQKAQIDALVRAHGGRARPVAFFHVLRQPVLEADDQAFLLEHADDLGASDLLRWRARCDEGFTGPVIRHLARRAIRDPRAFKHEVLDLPRIEMLDAEWRELADLVRGKVPDDVYAGVLARGGPRPVRLPAEAFFLPGRFDRSGLDPGSDFAELPADAAERTIDALSTPQILAARAAGAVSIDDEALLCIAGERARDAREDWSLGLRSFPELLRPAVLDKARRCRRDGERANLLTWLFDHGTPRAELVPIALAPMDPDGGGRGVVDWLSKQLSTRAAFEKHGFDVVSALLAQRAFSELGELVTLLSSAAPRGLLEAIQGAFALALIACTREALEVDDERRALAALSALACLDPPSRVSRAVHELRNARGVTPEVLELIGVNERLVKHGDATDASLEGVIAALHAVADAF